jgi:molybdenum cofactor guanylyltransferase
MATSLGLFAGVVLAGGLSTRMGTEKALLDVGGVPLWKRQYDLLGALGTSERWVSLRGDQTWLPLGIGRLNDSVDDLGPMAGIAAALAKTRYDHLAVLAVDMPAMAPSWYRRIGTRCADGIGVVGQLPSGQFEPLAAIYPKRSSARMLACVAERSLSLQEFVRNSAEDGFMRIEEIRPEDLPLFSNWNTPEGT